LTLRLILDHSNLRHFYGEERCFLQKIIDVPAADVDCFGTLQGTAPEREVRLDVLVAFAVRANDGSGVLPSRPVNM
jgi:hypothetical protein